jgi:hypothetical protein
MSIKSETAPSPASGERSPSGLPIGVMEDISVEAIILQVTERVIRELRNQGVRVVSAGGSSHAQTPAIPGQCGAPSIRTERMDMAEYRTPVLTERHVRKLHPLTGSVTVPRGTVVSPKARELLRDRNIKLCIE